MSMTAIWLILAAVFLIIELATISLCSLWFMIGAFISAAAAALGAALWLQIVLFLVVSGLCFVLVYPRVKHLIARNRHATNADILIGQTCIVTQTIDNISGTGAASVAGKTWTARTASGETVAEGALVRIDAIEGVKLIVTPMRDAQFVSQQS